MNELNEMDCMLWVSKYSVDAIKSLLAQEYLSQHQFDSD